MERRDDVMARAVAEKVAAAGGRTFFVGGYVRDRLLKKENKDIDIEVHGITPEALEGILDELGGRTEMGANFGIYGLKGTHLDIAMPRRETATGRGHRDFQVYVDPFLGTEKAARRRDFTINAMMEDVLTGELVDHFGGAADLKAGVLRHVDGQTFGEDPLRVLRAAQFAARFQFQIAEETVALGRTMDLTALAGERILGELEKALLKAKRPSIFFEEMRRMEQLSDWFPEVRALIGVVQSPVHHPEGDVWNHTMLVLDQAALLREGAEAGGAEATGCGGTSAGDSEETANLQRENTSQVGDGYMLLRPKDPLGFMLAALCHDFGKAVTTEVIDGKIHAFLHETKGLPLAEAFLGRITTGKKLTEYVLNLTELHMKPNVLAGSGKHPKLKSTNRMFDQCVDPEGLILLARADHLGRPGTEVLTENESFLCQRLQTYRQIMDRPHVMGADLVAAGLTPGPDFSEILAYAHKLRLAGIEKENALRQTLAYAEKVTGR